MIATVQQARLAVERAMGQREAMQADLDAEKARLAKEEASAHASVSARVLLQEAARITQEKLQWRISKLVTLAQESVFENPYETKMVFESKFGRTHVDLFFERNGQRVDPLEASGGGAVDVAAFGLQMSLWTLKTPKLRPVFVLDEPLKWLKGGSLPEKGAEMIREIAHRLGVQIIMVSHIPDQIAHADRVFRVVKRRGKSVVKRDGM